MTLGARLGSLWRRLNMPLPGTKARREGVVRIVEGRISKKTLTVVAAAGLVGTAIGIVTDIAGWISWPKSEPFKLYFAWADSLMCEPGWGGYSRGMWATVVAIGLVALLPVWLICGWVWVKGRQLVRQKTNLPVHGRPWFPLRLIEGQAALRRGRWMQVFACMLMLYLAWATVMPFRELVEYLLVPPSALKSCGTH